MNDLVVLEGDGRQMCFRRTDYLGIGDSVGCDPSCGLLTKTRVKEETANNTESEGQADPPATPKHPTVEPHEGRGEQVMAR